MMQNKRVYAYTMAIKIVCLTDMPQSDFKPNLKAALKPPSFTTIKPLYKLHEIYLMQIKIDEI